MESPDRNRHLSSVGSADSIAEHADLDDRTDVAIDDVERLIESDLSLVPSGVSKLLVEPAVLDPKKCRRCWAD